MIHRLYVIAESGAAVFEKIWLQEKATDSQLLSGFLSALSAFAIEALGSGGLQSIQLQNNEQLAIYRHESNFIIVVIVDDRDNKTLLNRIMKDIASSFYERYGNFLKEGNLIDRTNDFEPVIDKILKKKVSIRSKKKVIRGTILSLVILAVTFMLAVTRITRYDYLIPEDIDFMLLGNILLALTLFITVLFFIPSLIAGYISGKRRWGVVSAASLMIISFVLLLIPSLLKPSLPIPFHPIQNFDLLPWLVSFSPLIFSLTVLVGYLGAWIKERTRLYQLEPERIKVKSET